MLKAQIKKIEPPTSCSFIKKVSDDEVLLWNQLNSNNYYFALQLASKLIQYNRIK